MTLAYFVLVAVVLSNQLPPESARNPDDYLYTLNLTCKSQEFKLILALGTNYLCPFQECEQGSRLLHLVEDNQVCKIEDSVVKKELIAKIAKFPTLEEYCQKSKIAGMIGLDAIPFRFVILDTRSRTVICTDSPSLEKLSIVESKKLFIDSTGRWSTSVNISNREWAFAFTSTNGNAITALDETRTPSEITVGSKVLGRVFLGDVELSQENTINLATGVAPEITTIVFDKEKMELFFLK